MMASFRLALLVLLQLVAAGCTNDVISSSHATFAEARVDIDRGWIPPVLPASAVDIRERHNVDNNTGHGTFSFGAAGVQQFEAQLRPLQPGDVPLPGVSRRELEQLGYILYRYDYFDIAVDWRNRRGQFWLAYSR